MPSDIAFETEWSVLLAASSPVSGPEKFEKISDLLQKPIRWPVLLDCADQHGVTSLLDQALSGIQDQMPAAEFQRLDQRYRANVHKTLFLARELIRILDCLDALGFEAMPYKGVVLAETVYGDMALRQAGDIDLLIRLRDFSRIQTAVQGLGYTPHLPLSPKEEQACLQTGYECTFDTPTARNLLELHWALQPRFYAVDINMDGLFQRSVAVTVAGRTMKTLSPEDLMLVLSLHAAKHAWGRLIYLSDVAKIMGRASLNWDRIQRQASELGIARILRVTLLLANRLLRASIPSQVDAMLAEDTAAVAITEELAAATIGGITCDSESLSYFRLMLRLRERQVDRLRFLSRLAFTPGLGEWRTLRLPPVLFPLYRVVRLSRLAARLARA